MRKPEIKKYLQERDWESLLEQAGRDRRLVYYLFPYLYSTDELVRKRSIEALGLVCAFMAQKDKDLVRDVLRRLWWSINDESGGIGWSAAEAMAEIIKHRPEDFADYGSITVSFIDEEFLLRGVLWAAGTLARVDPTLVKFALNRIIELLDHPNPILRGYAARAAAAAGAAPEKLALLKNDPATVQVYVDGKLRWRTVAELAGHEK